MSANDRAEFSNFGFEEKLASSEQTVKQLAESRRNESLTIQPQQANLKSSSLRQRYQSAGLFIESQVQ